MAYREINVRSHIESIEDVKGFVKDLANEGLLVHPEDGFADSVDLEKANILPQTAQKLDEILERCWEVSESNGIDLCEIFYDELMEIYSQSNIY